MGALSKSENFRSIFAGFLWWDRTGVFTGVFYPYFKFKSQYFEAEKLILLQK